MSLGLLLFVFFCNAPHPAVLSPVISDLSLSPPLSNSQVCPKPRLLFSNSPYHLSTRLLSPPIRCVQESKLPWQQAEVFLFILFNFSVWSPASLSGPVLPERRSQTLRFPWQPEWCQWRRGSLFQTEEQS